MTLDTILPTPDIFSARRVLCIQPHYDDNDIAAVRCYTAQFTPSGMDELLMALNFKSQQITAGKAFDHGEPFKILHPSALHCGL